MRTDLYELTMVDAALRSGVADRPATFEVTARRLPPDRPHGVVAGTGRLLEALQAFRFDADDLTWLVSDGHLSPAGRQYLSRYRFRGTVDAYVEGELWYPHSPVLAITAPFSDAVLLETIVLSILNHDSAVAAAASRIVRAARGRDLIEMGGRRTHEEAAIAAARAAFAVGFSSTSNLAAASRYGIPVRGTAAHAFILAFEGRGGERAAFDAQIATMGTGTTLLVDTYDVAVGIDHAVAAARAAGADGPGAIRLDSDDPAVTSRRARTLLDALGARQTRIIVSGDIDENAVERLESGKGHDGERAPIDGYGVGTSVVTGGGHPTAGFIYKLVALDEPAIGVAKRSPAKEGRPGRKQAWRVPGEPGDVVGADTDAGPPKGRPLLRRVMAEGHPTGEAGDLEAARRHHAFVLDELHGGAA
jgi:nicotinate phosphoribosyltransferase